MSTCGITSVPLRGERPSPWGPIPQNRLASEGMEHLRSSGDHRDSDNRDRKR
jgi:hypothetical protein